MADELLSLPTNGRIDQRFVERQVEVLFVSRRRMLSISVFFAGVNKLDFVNSRCDSG